MEVGTTTDYAWDSVTQNWRYSPASGERVITDNTSSYSYGDGRFLNSAYLPNFYRKWSRYSSDWVRSAYGVLHTITSSFAIRCMKQ